eukprot:scaffold16610_cov135-Isochrysis_galbana.AAC.1
MQRATPPACNDRECGGAGATLAALSDADTQQHAAPSAHTASAPQWPPALPRCPGPPPIMARRIAANLSVRLGDTLDLVLLLDGVGVGRTLQAKGA